MRLFLPSVQALMKINWSEPCPKQDTFPFTVSPTKPFNIRVRYDLEQVCQPHVCGHPTGNHSPCAQQCCFLKGSFMSRRPSSLALCGAPLVKELSFLPSLTSVRPILSLLMAWQYDARIISPKTHGLDFSDHWTLRVKSLVLRYESTEIESKAFLTWG